MMWIRFWLVEISINSRHVFFIFFYFNVVALTSSTCASLMLALAMHRCFTITIHLSHLSIISSTFSSYLVSFSHLFFNFYLNSKRNSKLSFTLTSTCSILTHAYSPALIILFDIQPHYFSSLWIRPLMNLY